MPEFEVNPTRRRRIAAIALVIIGTGVLVFSERVSSRLIAAIMLLNAWELAFLPSLPFNLRLGEIYQRGRQGWRMSWASRVISLVTIAAAVFATYLQIHGR